MKRLLWKFDLLIYRLFYWRWSPRLKADPDLAYVFSKIGAAWTNGNPPKNRQELDAFIVKQFRGQGKRPILISGTMPPDYFLTIKGGSVST
jgi:hypothetical protein